VIRALLFFAMDYCEQRPALMLAGVAVCLILSGVIDK
jgi:hypothetical protein